jgi:hypothetical protein
MTDYRNQIEMAIRAAEILSPTTYAWFRQPSPQLPRRVMRSMTPRTAREYLLYSLQSRLYGDFYCQGFPTPTEEEDPTYLALGMTPFVLALSKANAGTGCRESGWEVRAVAMGRVLARKDGLEVWAQATDCIASSDAPVEVGAQISLCLPKELLNMSPGFYMALGNHELPHGETSIVRFYWHLTPEVATAFVRAATTRLNEAELSFRLKVLRDPTLYRRCDAGVIYALSSDYPVVSEILAAVHAEVAGGLRDTIPAFVKPLAPGLGLAEDPGALQSFGEHRCHLLADALISAYEASARPGPERTQAVINRFTEEGIDLDSPFLNPGSTDTYTFGWSG